MVSPTQRTLKYLRDKGYIVAIAESYNFFTKQRKDLFGFIDLVALKDGEIIGVQCTSRSNVSARIKKIKGLDAHKQWLDAGGKIQVIGWGKTGKTKRKIWTARIEHIT